ncbi:hypothetical protein SynPROS91_00266 [Synechococcus sp. PROS-9-1]|nr:hypothetical protein SynPROS91_00266 [Synechococcus sp. PROS-9-1]
MPCGSAASNLAAVPPAWLGVVDDFRGVEGWSKGLGCDGVKSTELAELYGS